MRKSPHSGKWWGAGSSHISWAKSFDCEDIHLHVFIGMGSELVEILLDTYVANSICIWKEMVYSREALVLGHCCHGMAPHSRRADIYTLPITPGVRHVRSQMLLETLQ